MESHLPRLLASEAVEEIEPVTEFGQVGGGGDGRAGDGGLDLVGDGVDLGAVGRLDVDGETLPVSLRDLLRLGQRDEVVLVEEVVTMPTTVNFVPPRVSVLPTLTLFCVA